MNSIAPLHFSTFHSAPLPPHSTPQTPSAPLEQHQPPAAPDTPQKDPHIRVNGREKHQESTLVDDGNLIARLSARSLETDTKKTFTLEHNLTLETSDRSDTIHISNRADGRLNVEVNGKSYDFNVRTEKDGKTTKLHIKTKGGDDNIKIDADVRLPVKLEAGDGDDRVQAGGGSTRLFGGKDNDHLQLGSGAGYAEGNDGDDTLVGGTGNAIMYGNNGNDRLYAGSGLPTKQSHLDGGNGADRLYAGNGHAVMNGGLGDDVLVGHDRTTFYSGKGKDVIWSKHPDDRIYAKNSDKLLGASAAQSTIVTPNEAGKEGFNIQGTQDEKQRIEDDIELLRSSPTGQKMLTEMDAAAGRIGASVTIKSSDLTQYTINSGSPRAPLPTEGEQEPDAPNGHHVHNGIRGHSVTDGAIEYDPASFHDRQVFQSTPITNFYHEMVHAYNGATGSFLPGTTKEQIGDKPPQETPNAERQAVGLPTDAEPFDIDNDPLTPPTSTNQPPFTENALREEMGHVQRTSYRDY